MGDLERGSTYWRTLYYKAAGRALRRKGLIMQMRASVEGVANPIEFSCKGCNAPAGEKCERSCIYCRLREWLRKVSR